MSEALHFSTAAALAKRLESGELTSVALTEAFLDRIAAIDGKVEAFLHLDREDALAQARASDERRAAGQSFGLLDGIPVGLKDVIAVTGQPLTGASQILSNFVSPYDATVTTKLKAAGAVLVGRLNLDEFAMGSSTENSSVKTTANPWDLERIPGGSSGGSAAAVAAGELPLTLGSDTGGSIRQPAALCGVVGLKPTYGRVSRWGLAAYASSLDQIGPFARTVEDCAALLGVIAGYEPRDSTSLNEPVPDYVAALREEPKPRVLGVPKEYFAEGLSDEVRAKVEQVIAWYASQGYQIREVSLPRMNLAVPVYYIVATAEASSNLARYDGIRYGKRATDAEDGIDLYFKTRGEGFGPEVKRRIILGTYVLSSGYYDAYYKRAQKVRTLIRDDFAKALEGVDALLTPTSPTTAFKRGEKANDPLAMYLSDIYTIAVNLAGLPGISLPAGFSAEGLPIGFQLIGRPLDETGLLRIAHHYEQAHAWSAATPNL
jgi:aspartyl-tRNA(Asn)/glutamyl-tRNA(Gln) amidotransferase subunit A